MIHFSRKRADWRNGFENGEPEWARLFRETDRFGPTDEEARFAPKIFFVNVFNPWIRVVETTGFPGNAFCRMDS
ncbi:MAG: hypothetical protein Ct9H300mP25_08560 [Acidobacteriota bacterium]|nr:MAG: hypothetical protein Ct9H300mP25_08560 [Acidobacteriota bacterium]